MKKTFHFAYDIMAKCGKEAEQLNEISEQLRANGWAEERNKKKADIIFVMFCLMTTDEINAAMDWLIKFSKKGYKGKLLIGGCMAKSEQIRKAVEESLPNLNFGFFKTNEELFKQLHIVIHEDCENLVTTIGNMAVVNISYGCRRRCAFCKVQYISYDFMCVPMALVIEKVIHAKEQGFKFITIGAMNSTEYYDNGNNLANLLKALLEIPGVIYELTGVVIAELTDEMIEIIKNPRICIVQLEIQSFIPEVRKNMNVGVLSTERILSVIRAFENKKIISCIMVGFYGERDANFKEQLDLIERENLYFCTLNSLVPTPSTKAGELRNPSTRIVRERMKKLQILIMKLRRERAKTLLNKTVVGTVINVVDGKSTVLIDGGIFVESFCTTWEIGQQVSVTPRYVHALLGGSNQNLILSEEITEASRALYKIRATAEAETDVATLSLLRQVLSPEELVFHFGFELGKQEVTDSFNPPEVKSIYKHVKEYMKF